MTFKCCACSGNIEAEDDVYTFYLERCKRGEKSGLLGLYPHPKNPNRELTHVHIDKMCLEKFAGPDGCKQHYDLLMKALREEAREDVYLEVRQDILEEYGLEEEDVPVPEFIMDPDDLPNCIFCKRRPVWHQELVGGRITYCPACQEFWDDEEFSVDPNTLKRVA
jgi:hypothetical protein